MAHDTNHEEPFDLERRMAELKADIAANPCPPRLVKAFLAECDRECEARSIRRWELSLEFNCDPDHLDRLAAGEALDRACDIADLWEALDGIRFDRLMTFLFGVKAPLVADGSPSNLTVVQ